MICAVSGRRIRLGIGKVQHPLQGRNTMTLPTPRTFSSLRTMKALTSHSRSTRAHVHSITSCQRLLSSSMSRSMSTIPSWATLDPKKLGTESLPHHVGNIVDGQWQGRTEIENKLVIPNPMDKDAFPLCTVADTSVEELGPFIKSMESVSKSGVHNPLKNVERYLMYGDISRKVCVDSC